MKNKLLVKIGTSTRKSLLMQKIDSYNCLIPIKFVIQLLVL